MQALETAKTTILSPLCLPFHHAGLQRKIKGIKSPTLTVFYVLFYFGGRQTHERVRVGQGSDGKTQGARFSSAKEARNRKVRGLWKRGNASMRKFGCRGRSRLGKFPLSLRR